MRNETNKNEKNEKVITADFSKENVEKKIFEDPSKEELQRELEEIKKKRAAYLEETEQEVLAIRKENVAKKKKKMASFAKVAVVVLVAGIGLFTFSMRSEATRMWWLESVDRIIGNDSGHVVNNDGDRAVSEITEDVAMAEIEEKAGVPMPELYYKPSGMEFDGYEYDETIGQGTLYYLYKDFVVTIEAYTADKNTAYSWSYDGEILKEETVESNYGSVAVLEILAEGDETSSSVAEWTYHNHQYLVAGKLPFEELKQIIENIFY